MMRKTMRLSCVISLCWSPSLKDSEVQAAQYSRMPKRDDVHCDSKDCLQCTLTGTVDKMAKVESESLGSAVEDIAIQKRKKKTIRPSSKSRRSLMTMASMERFEVGWLIL